MRGLGIQEVERGRGGKEVRNVLWTTRRLAPVNLILYAVVPDVYRQQDGRTYHVASL